MAKTILKFDQFGGIQADAIGFTGTACAETTEKLLKGLSAKAKAERKKPEYNQLGRRGVSGAVKAGR